MFYIYLHVLFWVSLMVLAALLGSLTVRISVWYWIMAWMRAS